MKLLAIDGNSILNRAYYGIRPLTTSKGFNTNAIYGFLTILHKHMKDENECRICVAFDRKEKTHRHKIFEAYKAGRKPMPQELYEQMPVLKQILQAMGIPCIEKAGLEADDIIGILSNQCVQDKIPCVIITGDRDAFQLINDLVTVKLAVSKAKTTTDETYTPKTIFEKYGLTPEQLIDLKALMGDSSDNIPGVPGVGEKTAINLLQKYGTLENVFSHIQEQKGALKERLIQGKDSAFMSRDLGRIIQSADIGLNQKEIAPPQFNIQELTKLFTELEMSSMPARFGLSQIKEQRNERISFISIEDAQDIFTQDVLYLFFDNEYIHIKYKDDIVKILPEFNYLKKIADKQIITHDAKPFLHLMKKNKFEANLLFDTMIAAYILNPSLTSYKIETLIQNYLQFPLENKTHAVVFLEPLYHKMLEELQKNNEEDLYKKIELPLCEVLAQMEFNGFTMDRNFLEQFGMMLDKSIKESSEAVYIQAGQEFNINSPKQLGAVLFEDMHLPTGKRNKSGYSTSKEVLERLKWQTNHPIIDNILDYRMLTKLKSTYIDSFLSKLDGQNKIHTVFTQTVTQTGRISSTEPNLQNIPVRTELGKQLRKAFIAKDDYVLLDADYSQIELRVLAHIADDKVMQAAFNQNVDIHTITASQVFGLPENMITPELRRRAKAVNFGIVYGIGEYSLSQDIGVSVKEAKDYISNYLNTYQGAQKYMTNIVNFAEKNGYVQTMFGRRRYVPDIHAKNKQIRAFAQRVCLNTPIQGTAADLIKSAMVQVFKELKKSNLDAQIILQVHDELIVEVHKKDVVKVKDILKNKMEHAAKLSVPLIVDVGEGSTWFDAKI